MRYDYRCTQHHITTREFPMGQHPETIPCPICRQIATRYFGAQRVQVTHVLWAGSAPQEIPIRDNGNPIDALAHM